MQCLSPLCSKSINASTSLATIVSRHVGGTTYTLELYTAISYELILPSVKRFLCLCLTKILDQDRWLTWLKLHVWAPHFGSFSPVASFRRLWGLYKLHASLQTLTNNVQRDRSYHHPPKARELVQMLAACWAYHRTVKPQGAGTKWSQHCGPPVTISTDYLHGAQSGFISS